MKHIVKSANGEIIAEQFGTSTKHYYLQYNGKNIGWIRIREDGINLAIDYAQLLNEEGFQEIYTVVAQLKQDVIPC